MSDPIELLRVARALLQHGRITQQQFFVYLYVVRDGMTVRAIQKLVNPDISYRTIHREYVRAKQKVQSASSDPPPLRPTQYLPPPLVPVEEEPLRWSDILHSGADVWEIVDRTERDAVMSVARESEQRERRTRYGRRSLSETD